MVKIDGRKIQEIKDRFEEMALNEIDRAVNDPDTDELVDDDIKAINEKWKFVANKEIEKIKRMNPEKIFKSGLAVTSDGWREGYTKPSLESRKTKRRAKNKLARKSRKENRKK